MFINLLPSLDKWSNNWHIKGLKVISFFSCVGQYRFIQIENVPEFGNRGMWKLRILLQFWKCILCFEPSPFRIFPRFRPSVQLIWSHPKMKQKGLSIKYENYKGMF